MIDTAMGYIGCHEDKLPHERGRGSNLKNPGEGLLLELRSCGSAAAKVLALAS